MELLERLTLEYQIICKQLEEYEKQVSSEKLPNLYSKVLKNSVHYYIRTANTLKLIGSRDNPLVQKIQRNRFCKQSIKTLKQNIKAFDIFFRLYENYDEISINKQLPVAYQSIQIDMPEASFDVPKATSKSVIFPNQSYCTTIDGSKVKSKGEALIYNMLKHYNIDFTYERKLLLTDTDDDVKIVYPDFTIFEGGKTICWEHLGMIQNQEYFDRQLEKIRLYHYNNYVIGSNLIVTADKKDGSMNTESISKIIIGILR